MRHSQEDTKTRRVKEHKGSGLRSRLRTGLRRGGPRLRRGRRTTDEHGERRSVTTNSHESARIQTVGDKRMPLFSSYDGFDVRYSVWWVLYHIGCLVSSEIQPRSYTKKHEGELGGRERRSGDQVTRMWISGCQGIRSGHGGRMTDD